jgi:hypothetical protein
MASPKVSRYPSVVTKKVTRLQDVQELIAAFGMRVMDQSQSGIEKSMSTSLAAEDSSDSQVNYI